MAPTTLPLLLTIASLAMLTVTHTLAALLLTSRSHMTWSKVGEASQQLQQAIVEAVEGPLQEKWVVLLVDASAESLLLFDHLLDSLHGGHRPRPLLLLRPGPDWQDHLPPPSVLTGRCAVLLVTASWPSWLAEAGDKWTPAMILVINVNSSWDAAHLMKWPQLQLSPSLTLMEASYSKWSFTPLVYTSRPLSRDCQGHRLTKDLLGVWDVAVFSKENRLFPDRFHTFDGEVLHVASDLDDYPLIYEDGDNVDGTSIRILRSLGSWLNFTFTTTQQAEDGKWGELENGTWNGLLGEVYRSTKNITVNYFTVVYDRLQDFDHTTTYFYEGFGFALRIPPPLPAWMSLLYPFTPVLWACVGSALLLTTPTLYFLTRAASHNRASIQDAAITVFRSLVRQSSPRVPEVGAVRLLLAPWWVGCLILVVTYTCNLIAVLTVPVFPSTISTIEGLALSQFRNLLEEDVRTSETTYMLREQVYSGALAFFLPKHTPWRPRLDQGIRRLVEAGLVNKWYFDIMGDVATPGRQSSKGAASEKPLTLPNLQGPFLLLSIGLLAAFPLFLGELVTQ
ncbi:uncharacterized protein LOC121869529 isoform X2 [Homarus americanus]|uniref:uncharacterized protein LOC121869529 isoform X2 n=1 Tax=Homarus americanus TaxID=6706 RepID=UPI001C45DE27|nr:uncharacterized protein LOC121869529 isoform X2 [Homarus americanus]